MCMYIYICNMYVNIYIYYVYIYYMCIYIICIYIYVICVYIYIHTCVYVYVYIIPMRSLRNIRMNVVLYFSQQTFQSTLQFCG